MKYKSIEEIQITETNVVNQYLITGTYKGVKLSAFTSNAMCFLWLNDASDIQRHINAKRHAHEKLMERYNQLK